MEVQLNLPPGWVPHRVLDAATGSTQAALPESTRGARLDWEAEEPHRPVLVVARHPEVRRGHPCWTGDASLSAVGGEVDREPVLAQVLSVGEGTQLGYHLDASFTQGCSGISRPIGAITQERSRMQPDVLPLPFQKPDHRLPVVLVGWTHLDVRDQFTLWLLAQMDFVPRPVLPLALVAIAHLWIHHREHPISRHPLPESRSCILHAQPRSW